jgi:beta-mannosidase
MLANMDYPESDESWLAAFRAETTAQLERLGRHPSTAVVCGGSEVEQQAVMVGIPPAAARSTLTAELLPDLCRRHCPDVPFVPSSPCGGDLPFRVSCGVAHYFGVGAYRRPLSDARAAGVRFASECLAFANVPEAAAVDAVAARTPGGITPVHPAWKRGTPRDGGAGWDFDDVRDHYLRTLHGVDPVELRSVDPDRYLDESRLVSGEVMAEVLGEWRREASPCRGALLLQAADSAPGAGWGLLDSDGRPKPAYWAVRRACAPVAVWTTDEGLDGIDVHVANDTAAPLPLLLRVALTRDGGGPIETAERLVEVGAHGSIRIGVEQLLGRFADASWAYRFGPPGHDAVVASVHREPDGPPFAAAVRLRPGFLRPSPLTADDAGLEARLLSSGDEGHEVEVRANRLLRGVRVLADGHLPDDSWFPLAPGLLRRVCLRPEVPGIPFTTATVRSIDVLGGATTS